MEEGIGLILEEDEEDEVGKVGAKQRSKKWQRIFGKLQVWPWSMDLQGDNLKEYCIAWMREKALK